MSVMLVSKKQPLGPWWWYAAFVVVFMANGRAAVAQQAVTNYGASSTVDAYGNARPYYAARRAIGSFSNNTQRQALRSSQFSARRTPQRGGFGFYALPGDPAGVRRFRRSIAQRGRRTLPFGEISASVADNFRRYGGFGARAHSGQADDIYAILGRRYGLVEALAGNAPVRRALLEHGQVLPIGSHTEPNGTGSKTNSPPDIDFASDGTLILPDRPGPDKAMLETLEQADVRSRREGWAFFRDQNYRRAIRSFEAAGVLDSTNVEARIGLVFSYVSVGSLRAAAVEVSSFARLIDAPFAAALSVKEQYANADLVRQALFRVRLFAQSNDRVPSVQALQVLLQWHVGDKHEAIRLASVVARDFPTSPYASWAEQMNAAMEDVGASRP